MIRSPVSPFVMSSALSLSHRSPSSLAPSTDTHMIRFLSINHLAVIDRLELEFAPGLNVLTGETGAGKSILVGAVGLLVGGRASAELVRTGEETATVQAVFETPDGGEMIVRREVSAQGRSRAFVDGALVTSAALREAAGALVDLHGQHEHQVLLDPMAHLDLLDEFAGLTPDRGAVAAAFRQWQQVRDERDPARRERAPESLARRISVLPARRNRHASPPPPVKTRSSRPPARCSPTPTVCSGCAGKRTPPCTRGTRPRWRALGTVWKKVGELAALDGTFAPYLEARDAVKSQLEDLAFFLRSYAEKHRRLAGAAPGDRGSSRAARASEEKARPVARRCDRQRDGAAPGAARHRARHRARSGARRRAGGRARRVYLKVAGALSAAPPGRRPGIRRRAREGARRTRDAEDPLRGAVRATHAGGRLVGTRARRGGVLHLARTRART